MIITIIKVIIKSDKKVKGGKMKVKLQERTKDFKEIPITKGAFEKLKEYARISGSQECYGFLLTPQNKFDGVIYNAILAPNQKVSGASAGITGEAAAYAKAEIKNLGYKAIGFWHSHGTMNPHHSPTDDANMKHLLLSLASNVEEKYFAERKEGLDIEGNDLVFRRGNLELKVSLTDEDFSCDIKPIRENYFQTIEECNSKPLILITENQTLIINDKKLRVMAKNPCSVQLKQNNGKTLGNVGVAYSIVFNKYGKHYEQIGISRWCNNCENLETEVSEARLNLSIPEQDISFRKSELEEEFREKILR